jgi:hypothetical protein
VLRGFLNTLESFVSNTWNVCGTRYQNQNLELCYVLNLVLHRKAARHISSFFTSTSALVYTSSGDLPVDVPSMFVISDSDASYGIVRSAAKRSANQGPGGMAFHLSLGQVSLMGWRSVLPDMERSVRSLI